jgi:hypothetical protein
MRKFNFFLIILILALGISAFWVYRRNIFSKEVLKLEISGPSEAKMGDVVEYIVTYKNNGNFRLEDPELIFEAPENSMMLEGESPRQILTSEKLGEAIYPGEERNFSFRMRLIGYEGEIKIAKATLSYRPKNLKAKTQSSTSFLTKIVNVPITFDFDAPSSIAPEEKFNLKINYFSNVEIPIPDLRVLLEIPSGFEILELNPKPLENFEWKIGVLNKSEGGRIEILGSISGKVGEEKIFRAKLISWQEGKTVLLKEISKGVNLIKPSLFIRQEINGNPEYVSFPGDWLHFEIYFKNLGYEPLKNLFLVSKLEGDAFDFSTLKADLGLFKEGDNSIIFDWRKVSKLQYLAPIDEGKVEFWIKLKDDFPLTKNPKIKNTVFLAQAREEFETKISSKLEIDQRGYFRTDLFESFGSLPPEVGKETYYVIVWQVKNYYNDVKNVKVRAILPPEVNLTGKILPETEASKFSFDPQSREIVWSIGDLEAGKGITNLPATIDFQVSFKPTQEQRGKTPDIISEVKVTGEDAWTGQTLQSTDSPINTTLPDDETVTEEMGIVK